MNETITVHDGVTKIIHSGIYNVYDNRLSIKPIDDFEVIFIFDENQEIKDSQIKFEGDNVMKVLTITLFNFNNSLGTGTTSKMPILTTNQGKNILFSIHASTLGGNSTLKQVVVTFYETP